MMQTCALELSIEIWYSIIILTTRGELWGSPRTLTLPLYRKGVITLAEKSVDLIEDISWYRLTGSYLLATTSSGLLYLLLNHFWDHTMVMNIEQLIGDGLDWDGIGKVWFIFVWALAGTVLIASVLGQRHQSYLDVSTQVIKGLWVSLNAGVFEEIIYRLFGLLSAMTMLTFLNFITFGLVKWWYGVVAVPIANFFTLHALQPQLMEHGWLLGAAIVSASVSFRDGHKHLGLIGWINSWFMGMVFFWLVFNYGLLTAIVAHVLYDVIVFTFQALTSERVIDFDLGSLFKPQPW